jgi:two-component system sensor histidine kinase CreC
MAHDMSSPLSAAQASLELFTLEENPAEGRLLLDASRTSLMRLRDMLENLYGIAELHTAGLQLQPAATDLGALTQEVVKMYKARSARKGLTLTCSVTDVVTAEVDPDTVRRALGNLLDNAVDYTPQGGLIRVRTEGLGTRCLVEVADDGPGIPAHLLGQIRQPFVRGSTAKISEAGTHRGLGLAFVDLVAREHGGELLIECPEAGGSIFTLMLPVEPPARR